MCVLYINKRCKHIMYYKINVLSGTFLFAQKKKKGGTFLFPIFILFDPSREFKKKKIINPPNL